MSVSVSGIFCDVSGSCVSGTVLGKMVGGSFCPREGSPESIQVRRLVLLLALGGTACPLLSRTVKNGLSSQWQSSLRLLVSPYLVLAPRPRRGDHHNAQAQLSGRRSAGSSDWTRLGHRRPVPFRFLLPSRVSALKSEVFDVCGLGTGGNRTSWYGL